MSALFCYELSPEPYSLNLSSLDDSNTWLIEVALG